jgi:hypothetical protein
VITLANAPRGYSSLRRDHRTLARAGRAAGTLTLFKYVFYGQEATSTGIGPPLVGIFLFVSTVVSHLDRDAAERTTGRWRLMSMPL